MKHVNLHMKLLNKLNSNKLDNNPYKNSETFTAVVSTYSNNVLLSKFISYKVFDDKVSPDIYSIIKSKNEHRLDMLIELFRLIAEGYSTRNISKLTGYGETAITSIKKDPSLHIEAFPILKQFETS